METVKSGKDVLSGEGRCLVRDGEETEVAIFYGVGVAGFGVVLYLESHSMSLLQRRFNTVNFYYFFFAIQQISERVV